MSFINFEGTNFTLITDANENPWMIAKSFYLTKVDITSSEATLRSQIKSRYSWPLVDDCVSESELPVIWP